nr:hypothetical protein 1137p_00105 [Serratia proteamaculans]
MMEQRYRRTGGDVVPYTPVAGGDHWRIGLQGSEKFVPAMELSKSATHWLAVLLSRHGQSIASVAWNNFWRLLVQPNILNLLMMSRLSSDVRLPAKLKRPLKKYLPQRPFWHTVIE